MCVSCKQKKSPEELEIDHIISLAAGGTNELSNLVPICIDCHKKKTSSEWKDGSYNQNNMELGEDLSVQDKLNLLLDFLEENKDFDYIVALPPSGLRDAFLRVLKTENGRIVIALHDCPENLIKRITFYDDNSKKIEQKLTEREKKLHLREFKLDNTYFNRTYKRADYNVDIDGLTITKCVEKIIDLLKMHKDKELVSN